MTNLIFTVERFALIEVGLLQLFNY